jgi:iron complex transport system ATP-binding protein
MTQLPLLLTRDLAIRIHKKLICEKLNLTIQAGEIWGILGINGSGKTTLLQTLAGLHPLQQGDIWLNEKRLATLPLKTIAQSIGILFQDFTETFPQTVEEYCRASRYPHLNYFQPKKTHDLEIVTYALHTMGLLALAQRKIHHLSGGEKRRLALASILVQTPRLYLLDEPTNHLDVHYQIKVLSHFRQLTSSTSITVIMALHDVNLVQQFCTHVLLLLPNGHTLQGTAKDTLTTQNLFELYQHPLHAIQHENSIYWQPQSEIT